MHAQQLRINRAILSSDTRVVISSQQLFERVERVGFAERLVPADHPAMCGKGAPAGGARDHLCRCRGAKRVGLNLTG